MDLFDSIAKSSAPLADRMRPAHLSSVVGQEHLLGPKCVLTLAVESKKIPSMILWGPPGTGKTTIANVLTKSIGAVFIPFNAVLSGVPELRELLKQAEDRQRASRDTVLFIDEIHRFHKGQQDALLPYVEKGAVTLIGATTENPSFAVNAALLSRMRVYELRPLTPESILILLRRVFQDETKGIIGMTVSEKALQLVAENAHGDARQALTVIELAANLAKDNCIDEKIVIKAIDKPVLRHDKSGESHYNIISAFIKSMRGSDPDAAIYWMMRLVEAGDDPLYILRRMIIFASEDIGNADPRALSIAIDADRAFQRLGMPEGLFAIAQCCTYLASAPKSNASYVAFKKARDDIAKHGPLDVPKKLRNAATPIMASWGYGQGYQYPHDQDGVIQGEIYLPEKLAGQQYYQPKQVGYEAKISEYLERLHGKKEK